MRKAFQLVAAGTSGWPLLSVVGKISEAVLSVSGMNVRCTCKQASLAKRV